VWSSSHTQLDDASQHKNRTLIYLQLLSQAIDVQGVGVAGQQRLQTQGVSLGQGSLPYPVQPVPQSLLSIVRALGLVPVNGDRKASLRDSIKGKQDAIPDIPASWRLCEELLLPSPAAIEAVCKRQALLVLFADAVLQ
jgi:hypothetical protein